MNEHGIGILCLQETWVNSSSEELRDKYVLIVSTGIRNKERERTIHTHNVTRGNRNDRGYVNECT